MILQRLNVKHPLHTSLHTVQQPLRLEDQWAPRVLTVYGLLWASTSQWYSHLESELGRRRTRVILFSQTLLVAVASTPSAARIPGANLGQVSSALNIKTTRYSSLVPTPTETQQTNATLFTGVGSQALDAPALLGVAILLPFVWFLWQ
jgi:hypothetical protein